MAADALHIIHIGRCRIFLSDRLLEGMCVKTIVFTRPIRPASLAATQREIAVSRWDAKNIRPSACAEMPKRVKNQYDARLCPNKPVPKLSTAKRLAKVKIRWREGSRRGLTQRASPVVTSTSGES